MKDIRVIIIEDDPFISADIQDIIEDMGGIVVDIIPSFENALLAANNETVDLFTLDFEIVSGTTQPVAEKLTERHIPFITISGKSEKLKSLTAFNQSEILSKPVSAARLVEAIKFALSKRR